MATRKAYIDWNKLGEATRLENKKTYMVCTADDDTCVMRFATWYEAGTVVAVGLSEDAKIDGAEPTAEERLFTALFGRTRPFAVPEDGFYILTADYGVDPDECNGAFQDCKQQAICVGNRYGWSGEGNAIPAYWAEVPVLPQGLRLSSDHRPAKAFVTELTATKMARAEEGMAADPIAEKVYRAILKDTPFDGAAVDFPLGEAVYSVLPLWFACTLLDTHAMCIALSKVPAEAFLEFHDKVQAMTDQGKIWEAVEEFCKNHGIPDKPRWLMFQYISYLREDFRDFYHHRNKILARGGVHGLNLPAVLQEALAMSKIPFWVGRCVKLEALGAPEIILTNELRMLVEHIAMAKLGRQIVCVLPGFDTLYGVHPDGSRGSVRCSYGDMELHQLPVPEPEEPADEEPDDEDEGPGQEEPEKVIGVDYPYFASAPAPNFLMRKCRMVIWDNSKLEYLRDEAGNIEQFDTFPKERLQELNETARAEAGSEG